MLGPNTRSRHILTCSYELAKAYLCAVYIHQHRISYLPFGRARLRILSARSVLSAKPFGKSRHQSMG